MVAIGPWSVNRPLTEAVATGRPYLTLAGGEVGWTDQAKERWTGTEAEAKTIAGEVGGDAVPAEWVAAPEAARRERMAAARLDARCGGVETGKLRDMHRHDRTGEERA